MHLINLPYSIFIEHAQSRQGLPHRIVPIAGDVGHSLYLEDNGILLVADVLESEDPESDWQHFIANIRPVLDTGLTREGYPKTPAPIVGPQGYETRLGAVAFELKTDTELGFVPSESNPSVEYFKYQMPMTLNLVSAVAAWDSVPRFTSVKIQIGFYMGVSENDFVSVGDFTIGDGIMLAGNNHVGASYPPDSAWASTEVPAEVAPGLPLFIRLEVSRQRPCYKDEIGDDIAPYIDIDFNFHRRTE